MTSAVAGLSVSNVAAECAGPGVQVVVAIGLTVVKCGRFLPPPCTVNHR
jgi:hypothetical protein